MSAKQLLNNIGLYQYNNRWIFLFILTLSFTTLYTIGMQNYWFQKFAIAIGLPFFEYPLLWIGIAFVASILTTREIILFPKYKNKNTDIS